MHELAEIGYLMTITVSSVHKVGRWKYECGAVGEMRLGRETHGKDAPQYYSIHLGLSPR
jgi:hypothetical protein